MTIQWPKEKSAKGETMKYKHIHIKIKIEQHELNKTPGVKPGAPEGLVLPAALVTSVVLLLSQTR